MTRRVLSAVALASAVFALNAAPAPAPVPPKDCGNVKAGGTKVNVRSEKLRCRKARRYTRRYLRGDGAPRGFTCVRYGSETNIKFRCEKPGRGVFFGIRR